jgi:hypothetical protein
LTSHNYKDRYYYEEKYKAAKGSFVIGLIFVFVGILALLRVQFLGLNHWGFWLFIPAFFILLGGFHQLYTNMKYKKAVMLAVNSREHQGIYKLENIALEVGIRPSDLLQILSVLRDDGKVQYRFNADTGEIELGQKFSYVKDEKYIAPSKKPEMPLATEGKNFCLYCGQKLERDSKFCPSCGSRL